MPPLNTPPSLERLAYNNPGLTVDLGVGLWAWPLPMDVNGDGVHDLLVNSPDTPFNGVWYFRNIGSNEDPLFAEPVRLSEGKQNTHVSHVDGEVYVTTPGVVYPDVTETGITAGVPLDVAQPIHEPVVPGGGLRGEQWFMVDFTGNGALDIVVGVGDWSEYGSLGDAADGWNDQGEWTKGPLHGFVYLVENLGTTEDPEYAEPVKIEAGGEPIDAFGSPSPVVADFTGDGTLDIVTGEFLDTPLFFENVGARTEPEYAEGRPIPLEGGGELAMDLQMIVVTAIDWNLDGHVDLVVGEEDGRVSLVENTGRVEDGVPVFHAPVYFQQEAQYVKVGALSTPSAVDWDGDGLEDLIVGDTAGRLSFVKNLGGDGDTPTWAAPERLSAGGEEIRHQAGFNGSIQGPSEAKWGYTAPVVADWNHDGLPDIVVNDIWGKIVWYENVGTRTGPSLAQARPVEIERDGPAPAPAWNWWEPQGGELVTQWRTTPFVIDLNEDGLNDLVMLDHEGYLAFFERVETDDQLGLLPGERIFLGEQNSSVFNRSGVAQAGPAGLLQMNHEINGGSGRRKFTMVDWTGDGMLDILANGAGNIQLLENTNTGNEPWLFRDTGQVANGHISAHTTSPTIVDWDSSPRPDLLIGGEDGHLYYQPWNYDAQLPERRPEPEGDLKDLVGEWSFDESTGYIAEDASGYGNFGVINGATWTEGHTGAALHFDGFNDYVDLSYTVGPHLDRASGIAFSAWVQPDSMESGTQRMFGTRINGGAAGLEVSFVNQNGVARIAVAGRSQHPGDSYRRLDFDASTVRPRQWHHVAGVLDFDNDSVSLYVDGVERPIVRDPGRSFGSDHYRFGDPTQPDSIGRSPDGTAYFRGVLDSVRAHRVALSGLDINAMVIDDALDHYREHDELQTPLYQQLRNHLSAFELHRAQGRDEEGLHQLERFVSALENPALAQFSTEEAKLLLGEQARLAIENYTPADDAPPGEEPTEPSDPLVASWTFDNDEGDTVADSSGLNHHGTLDGGERVAGRDGHGGALRFDGTGGVVLDHVPMGEALSGAPGITMAGWVHVEEVAAPGSEDNWLFGTRIDGGFAGAEVLMVGDEIRVAGRSHSGESYQRSEFTFDAIGEWAHVAGVLDFGGNSIRLFINGDEQEAATTNANFGASSYEAGTATQPDSIGRSPAMFGSLTGTIDELRVYRTALDAEEIAGLMSTSAE